MIRASVHHGYDGAEEGRPSLIMERDNDARGLQVRAPGFPFTPETKQIFNVKKAQCQNL